MEGDIWQSSCYLYYERNEIVKLDLFPGAFEASRKCQDVVRVLRFLVVGYNVEIG